MDIIQGDEIPMYPMGHNFKDLANQLGDSVGTGLKTGSRWIYDHPATVGAIVGAGVLGSAMLPELAATGTLGAAAETMGIIGEGEMLSSELGSALGSIGRAAGAA